MFNKHYVHRYCFVLDRSLCMARDLLENKNELLSMYTIRQPSWNKIWIGQVTTFLSFLVLLLQVRLNGMH